MSDYEKRVADQIQQYSEGVEFHPLPDVFHYWSGTYLRPKFVETFGVAGTTEFYCQPIIEAARIHPGETIEIVSIGSGECTIEVAIAKHLLAHEIERFHILATELSSGLVAKSNDLIAAEGLSAVVHCVEADLNTWTAEPGRFHIAMASHSLHHVVELEHLFATVQGALKDDGVFAISDMIGRNGHMRWPETLDLLQRFWAILPESHRYHRILKRTEIVFQNHDASTQGFEGIRAQDILPLLLLRFYPGKFLAVGGLTDIFTSRGFGGNFDLKNAFDKAFIDLVQHVNEAMLTARAMTPTLMFGYFHKAAVAESGAGLRARDCVRWP